MKKIHLFSKDQSSNFQLKINGNSHIENNISIELTSYQNTYITNKEQINVGDWFIFNNIVKKCYFVQIHEGIVYLIDDLGEKYNFRFCDKIILTTDLKLIKDGIQILTEWFDKVKKK